MQTSYDSLMPKNKKEYLKKNSGGSDRVTLELKRFEMELLLSILKKADTSNDLQHIITEVKTALGDEDGIFY